jgi:hypothetical protein
MLIFRRWLGVLLIAPIVGSCGFNESPTASEPVAVRTPEEPLLARFSSDPHDSTAVLLQLRPDGSFRLQIAPQRDSVTQTFSGKLEVAQERYRLFFPDTIAHFNELITPVHRDASVVVYPDYSVVLDKKLRQLYVKNTLLTADSAGYTQKTW